MAGANELKDEDYASAVFEQGDGLVVDLSNIQELSFEALPKGFYDAVIDEANYQISKTSQKPMFQLIWKIVDNADYENRKVYQYLSFSQGALRGTKAQLMRLDASKFAGAFNPKAIAESGDLLGTRKKLKLTIQPGQDGNNDSNQVQIQPDGGTASGNASGGAFFGG